MTKTKLLAIAIILFISPLFVKAQIVKDGSFYFSWGYNTEWYTHSSINILQPALNNNYTFDNVVAHDHKGWNQALFTKQLTIPQYNYRIGYFFNKAQDWGLELNFDHAKYVLDSYENIHMTGTFRGRNVDTMVVSNPKNIGWELNNGANFLSLNLVRKIKIIESKNEKFRLDALLKAGAGPNIPHVQNTLFGENSMPHFQFGGWNVDADCALRTTFFKHFYLELFDKGVYARYWGLRIYDGIAKQNFACYEMALVAGATFKL